MSRERPLAQVDLQRVVGGAPSQREQPLRRALEQAITRTIRSPSVQAFATMVGAADQFLRVPLQQEIARGSGTPKAKL